MMKRKFLAVILPIIGCATVVGSGFSAWYFGGETAVADGNKTLGIFATPDVNTGALSISELTTFNSDYGTIILDQGGARNDDPTVGIMLGKSSDKEVIQRDFTYKMKISYAGNDTLEELGKGKYAIKFTVFIKIDEFIDDYLIVDTSSNCISLTDSEEPNYSEDGGNIKHFVLYNEYLENEGAGTSYNGTVYKWEFTLESNDLVSLKTNQKEWYLNIDFSTSASLVNKVFNYANESKKPSSHDEYNDMLEAYGTGETAKKVSVDTTVELVDTFSPNAGE